MISFAVDIKRLSRGPSGHHTEEGLWVPNEVETPDEVFKGYYEPLSLEELQTLPEGQSVTEAIKIITAYPLAVSRESSTADLVRVDEKTYEVQKVLEYVNAGMGRLGHYEVICFRVDG